MANEERDRYGEKLKEAERGREDDYFARRDRELIQKMRAREAAERCPKCGTTMQTKPDGSSLCPQCAGA